MNPFERIKHVRDPRHMHGRIPELVITRAVDKSVTPVWAKHNIMSVVHHHIECVFMGNRPLNPPVESLSVISVSSIVTIWERYRSPATMSAVYTNTSVNACGSFVGTAFDKHAPTTIRAGR